MTKIGLPSIPTLSVLSIALLSSVACSAVQVGIEQEPTLAQPTKTIAPNQSPSPVTVSNPLDCVYDAVYVADMTVPDDTEIPPGGTFTKTWQMRNSGTCPWEPGTQLAFSSGERMNGSTPLAVGAADPGADVTISVNLQAPVAPGTYRGDWQLRNADGTPFGSNIYVQIIVPATGFVVPLTKEEQASWGWTSYVDGNAALDLAFDAMGNPRVATPNGIAVWDLESGAHQMLTTEDGLPDDLVTAVVVGSDGTLWAGTGSGLARCSEKWCDVYTTDSGLSDDRITALTAAGDGTLWIGTARGLDSYDGALWVRHADGVAITDIDIGYDGKPWVAWRGNSGHSALTGELYRYSGAGLESVPHDSPTPAAVSFRRVVATPLGGVWATGDGGEVYRLNEGHITTYTTADGLTSDTINDIEVTLDGHVSVSYTHLRAHET